MGHLPRHPRTPAPPGATPVSYFMTPRPCTVLASATMQRAHELMRDLRVRHLPVLRAGVPVGIVSQRDLHLLETLKDINPTEVPVEDAMSSSPHAVHPDTPLSEVASRMLDFGIGSVLVMRRSTLLGIFTTTDALAALAALARLSRVVALPAIYRETSPRDSCGAKKNPSRRKFPTPVLVGSQK